MVSGNKELPNRFDSLLKKFLIDQSTRPQNKELNLLGNSYLNIFEQYKPEHKANKPVASPKDEPLKAVGPVLKKPGKHFSIEQFLD